MAWEIFYVEQGYCRIVYRSEGGGLIALQDEGENYGGVQAYTMTEEEEPCSQFELNARGFHRALIGG